MSKSKESPVYGQLSNKECEECGDLIPAKRLAVINTEHCVGCAEELEAKGQGISRHTMEFHVKTQREDIEEIETTIVRKPRKG